MKFSPDKYFLAVISILALWIALLCVYTPSRPPAVFCAVTMASAIGMLAYRRQSWRDKGGLWIMLVAAALVGSGVIINAWYFTTAAGGTDSMPVFQNYDAAMNWEYLTLENLDSLRTTQFPGIRFNTTSGYPYLLLALMYVTGPSLAFALGINMLCVLLTIVLAGAITRRCLDGSISPQRRTAPAFCGMLVLAVNCYFLVTGTIVIKDAVIQLLFATLIYLLVALRFELQPAQRIIWQCIGILLLISLVRHMMLLLALPGFFIICSPRRQWKSILCLSAFTAACYLAVMSMPTLSFYDSAFSILSGPRATYNGPTSFTVDTSRLNILYGITGNLDEQMPWQRLLWLPALMACQFLIPFPWNFTRDMIFGPSQFVAHIGYPGYFMGILAGYYIVFMFRKGPAPVNRLLAYGALLYAAVAFQYNGAVSRYCLMFIPLAAPAISMVLLSASHLRSLWIWCAGCATALSGVLIACYHLSH